MNYFKTAPRLVGENLFLRNIDLEQDTLPFYQIFREPDMHLWTGNQFPESEKEAHNQLKLYRDLDEIIAWAIILNDGTFAGTYWIAPHEQDGKKIIGSEAQRIGKKFWRTGVTRQARQLVYDFAFNILEVEEIHAQAWSGNENSCRSMEAVGFHLLHQQERLFEKVGKVFVENHYVLHKIAWYPKK